MENNPFKPKIEPLENRDVKEWKDLEKSFEVLHGAKSKWKLSKKQKLVAYALSIGWDYKQVSDLSALRPQTVEKWLKDEAFLAFLDACDHVNGIDEVNEYLKKQCASAAAVVNELMLSENAPEAVRFQAAKKIMDQVLGSATQRLEVISLKDLYQKMDKQDEEAEEIDNTSHH